MNKITLCAKFEEIRIQKNSVERYRIVIRRLLHTVPSIINLTFIAA